MMDAITEAMLCGLEMRRRAIAWPMMFGEEEPGEEEKARRRWAETAAVSRCASSYQLRRILTAAGDDFALADKYLAIWDEASRQRGLDHAFYLIAQIADERRRAAQIPRHMRYDTFSVSSRPPHAVPLGLGAYLCRLACYLMTTWRPRS